MVTSLFSLLSMYVTTIISSFKFVYTNLTEVFYFTTFVKTRIASQT